MTEDARFRDAHGGPLRLRALDAGDLQVISGLVQDSIFPASEMAWQRSQRRFGLRLNRFRWEDARASSVEPERVQSVLAVEDVMAVRTRGIDRSEGAILSLLSIGLEPGEDGTGTVTLLLAGGGALALDVEAIEVTLRDVTRPYHAPSGKVPHHND